MITIETSNLGYLTCCKWVFKDLGLLINTDTKSFLIVKGNHRTYRKISGKNWNENEKSWESEPTNERGNGETKNRRCKRSSLRSWGYNWNGCLSNPRNYQRNGKETNWIKKSTVPGKDPSNADTIKRNPNSTNTTVKIKWLYSLRRCRNIWRRHTPSITVGKLLDFLNGSLIIVLVFCGI